MIPDEMLSSSSVYVQGSISFNAEVDSLLTASLKASLAAIDQLDLAVSHLKSGCALLPEYARPEFSLQKDKLAFALFETRMIALRLLSINSPPPSNVHYDPRFASKSILPRFRIYK
ncbi:MAG: hypothetical protein K2X60_06410 [Xanthobacteraceae bacterium]|nr:hypothetical protein [Xanthobacteraceae bacterium]